jgi:hypothetical protein
VRPWDEASDRALFARRARALRAVDTQVPSLERVLRASRKKAVRPRGFGAAALVAALAACALVRITPSRVHVESEVSAFPASYEGAACEADDEEATCSTTRLYAFAARPAACVAPPSPAPLACERLEACTLAGP